MKKSKLNNLEMFYPNSYIRVFSITSPMSETEIIKELLNKCIAYINISVSSKLNIIISIFVNDKQYNEFIAYLVNNGFNYAEKKLTFRNKIELNDLLENYYYTTNIDILQ